MTPTVETSSRVQEIDQKYRDFILDETHPCIMAKSLFRMDKYHLHAYNSMTDAGELQQLLQDLQIYLDQYDFSATDFQSFIAVFPDEQFKDELTFEKKLWEALQMLHELDDQPWDKTVSDDPHSPEFSFSLGGRAFYIVGLHPESSRLARRAPYPTLVFNLHHQFEKLREIGTYQTVRDTIRANDEALQGSINPVLRDFGKDSETKQYSGRHVEENWKCPFHKK